MQKATEAIIEKLHRPAQLQSSTIDFSKPRLVQITVSDVGICMPLLPLVSGVCVCGGVVYCIGRCTVIGVLVSSSV